MAGRFQVSPALPWSPPHQGSQLSSPPLTQALQPHSGDTMYLYSSTPD
jgi:hypothetical protein